MTATDSRRAGRVFSMPSVQSQLDKIAKRSAGMKINDETVTFHADHLAYTVSAIEIILKDLTRLASDLEEAIQEVPPVQTG
jgi:hypothetical protein